jgi:hypothetical protein
VNDQRGQDGFREVPERRGEQQHGGEDQHGGDEGRDLRARAGALVDRGLREAAAPGEAAEQPGSGVHRPERDKLLVGIDLVAVFESERVRRPERLAEDHQLQARRRDQQRRDVRGRDPRGTGRGQSPRDVPGAGVWDRDAVVQERPWVTPVGLAVVALVIAANAAEAVGFGLSGDALVVTVGVAVYTMTAVLFLLWVDAPRLVVRGLLLTMSAAAAVTHHGDPTRSGGVGLYLGMAFAPLRLDVRRAAAMCTVGVLLFDAQLLLEAPNAGVFVLVVNGGAAFFFLLGLLLRREGEQRARGTTLLAELEASREAEKAAAALTERSRLAREMHDVLAHTLSGLVLQLDG